MFVSSMRNYNKSRLESFRRIRLESLTLLRLFKTDEAQKQAMHARFKQQ